MSLSNSQQDEVGFEPLDEVGLSIKNVILRANSTAMETVQLDSGYATKSNEVTEFVLEESVKIPEKSGKGHGTADTDETVIVKSNVKGVFADVEVGNEKRQPKLTGKGKA